MGRLQGKKQRLGGDERKAENGQAGQQGQGYQLTEHVRRYYETTKV